MGVFVAVQGFTYTLSGVTELAPRSAVITPAPSATIKVGGKGVYRGALTLTFPPGTLASPAFTASAANTAPAVFTLSSSKIRTYYVEGQPALGVGDISAQGMVNGSAHTGYAAAPVTVPATVAITAAGQTKVAAS